MSSCCLCARKCVCVSSLIVARQRLGKNPLIVARQRLDKITPSLLGNSSVFYAGRVVSKKSKRLVLSRTSRFKIGK
jgi:hypothetical protein